MDGWDAVSLPELVWIYLDILDVYLEISYVKGVICN